MAKFSLEEFNTMSQQMSNSKERKVGYFNSLKNDKDEAIVRFDYSSSKELEVLTIHKVKTNGMYRSVTCLRNSLRESYDLCPLCSSGNKVAFKTYIKMIEYTTDENGNIVANPVVWERPKAFAEKLKSFCDDYGDLREMIFKIKRSGLAGDIHTTYDILPANPAIYKQELYPKDFADLDSLDLSHHSYVNKTFDEMSEYVSNGDFPQKVYNKDNNNSQSTQQTTTQQQTTTDNVRRYTPASTSTSDTTTQNRPVRRFFN